MELNEAIERLKKAGLIAEETTEQALARMAANSYEGQVDEIVETIENVKPVKNYYEVDPDEDYVKAQFEIVMQDDTVWEVQFRKGHGFNWRGNVYPWRIIKNNNGGFTQVAFSLSQLRAYMKKVKAIQTESYAEDTGDPIAVLRRNVTNGAINRFENAQYDEWEQEPWVEEQNIKNIEFAEFLKVVMEAVGAKTQQELLDLAEDEEKFDDMVEAWFQYLLNEKDDCMGWDYTWGGI